MTWSFYGEKFVNSDFSGVPRVYQPFTIPNTARLKAVRSFFVFYNTPTFTALSMRIYANNLGLPTDLLYTFDKTWALGDACTAAYGAKEIYFDFTNPIWLRAGMYHLVPWISGASFSDTSHVSWAKGFPDPNIGNTPSIDMKNLAHMPQYAAFIGAEE